MNGVEYLWVALAGTAGAVCRFVLDGEVRSRVQSRLPVATIIINITGSLLLGLFSGLVLFHEQSSQWTIVGGTGFCGGFTTFSTASFESVRLLEQRLYRLAFYNTAGTLLVTVAVGGLGLAITRV